MKIFGLQKLTLLDYPGKVACTLFTGGCNFRCPFCHNASLVLHPGADDAMDESEVLAFLEKRAGVLDGVCVSGGEPLTQTDIGKLLRHIKQLGYAVKLDTNGSFPAALKELVGQGLADYVAMDIKNSPAQYPKTVGIEGYDTANIEESAAFLLSGAVPYEFRTTVVRELHTAGDFAAIGQWLRGASRYYLQSFVDSGDTLRGGLSAYSRKELEAFAGILRNTMKCVELRGI